MFKHSKFTLYVCLSVCLRLVSVVAGLPVVQCASNTTVLIKLKPQILDKQV